MARGRRSAARLAPVTRHVPVQVAPRPQASQIQPAQATASREPGLFGQMAATAGGVAIGSAVGHAIGGAMTGAFSSDAPAQQGQQPIQQQQQQVLQKPCEFELQQFLDCTRNHDLTLCEGFNDELKQCRMRYGA